MCARVVAVLAVQRRGEAPLPSRLFYRTPSGGARAENSVVLGLRQILLIHPHFPREGHLAISSIHLFCLRLQASERTLVVA